MLTSRTRIAVLAVVLLAGGAAAAVELPASATPSASVVISEAYGGGGNSGAPLANDFIELADRGSAAQDLAGWSVQYLPASPGADTTWQVTALSGSLAAGAHYLIGEAAGANTGAGALPTPDATGGINMSGTTGTVALVDSATALSCKTAADCAADASIVDLVGWGTAVVHEGASDAPATTNATSATRADTPDTDDNGTDFTAAAPTPTNQAGDNGGTGGGTGTGGGGTGQPGPLAIHDIQGDSWISPQNGKNVTDVPGIVTAVRSTGSSRGFWFQDPNPDNDPATSEGMFVFTSSAPTVQAGDSVLVSGKVSDFYPLSSGDTVAATSNLSTTEIDSPTVTVLSSGNPLPAPIVLGPTTVPDQYAPDLGGANIENTPITPSRSALDFYESIEGMRVEVDNARVVGPSDTFGEQYVTTKPTQNRTYRGGTELLAENATPSGRLEVNTIDGSDLGLNVGDTLEGATIGPLDWTQFGGYALIAATLGTPHSGGLKPVVATGPGRQQLSIATYNVENLAPSDDQSKFDRLAAGIVTNLAAPDIVAVEEVQDNDGATDDGVVAADATLTKLTTAIKAAGGPSYQWREIDPVNDQDGGEPGGNIRVVFLFNPRVVSFVDAGRPGVDRSTTGTQVVDSRGKPALTLSPGRIDPTNPVWSASRKPLVGEFDFEGKDVFVIANHFDAKLGDQNADGRFQFPQRSSEVQRAGQAAVEHTFVQSILNVDRNADVVVVGDLNDYQFSPALHVLTTGDSAGNGLPILTDLITRLPVNQRYTYDFDGLSEVLDHILVTSALSSSARYQVVHLNAEFSDQVSDHDPQVVDVMPR